METHEYTDPRSAEIAKISPNGAREQHIQYSLSQGCRDVNGEILQTIASGSGLRIAKPLLGRRYRQGV